MCVLLVCLALLNTLFICGCDSQSSLVDGATSHDVAYPLSEKFFDEYPSNTNSKPYYELKKDDDGYVTSIILKPKFKGNSYYKYSGGTVTVTFVFKVLDNTAGSIYREQLFPAKTIILTPNGDGQSKIDIPVYFSACEFERIECKFEGTAVVRPGVNITTETTAAIEEASK